MGISKDDWRRMITLIEGVLAKSWISDLSKEMIHYQLDTGGKRIRPAIVLGISKALNYDTTHVLPFAATVEIIHNASLVHDDIQDQDVLRRGRATAWKQYSVDQAINLGDCLFTLAFEVLMKSPVADKTKLDIIARTVSAVSELVNGQVQEITYRQQREISVDEYFSMIEGKTGSLFKLAVQGSFLLSTHPPQDELDDLGRIGTALGQMFQIRDDMIDLAGLKESRVPGADIWEGKISILTAIAQSRMNETDRHGLLDMLRLPRNQKSPELIKKVARIYTQTQALEEATTLFHQAKGQVLSNPALSRHHGLYGFLTQVMTQLSLPVFQQDEDFSHTVV